MTAIVCGAVSGNLLVRDFDGMAAFETWARAHADLAGALPIVATRRGRHVYCRTAGPHRTVTFPDGELRADGGYVVAPPSRHPDGGRYSWIVPLGGAVPVLDLGTSGLARPWCAGAYHEVSGGSDVAGGSEVAGGSGVAGVAGVTGVSGGSGSTGGRAFGQDGVLLAVEATLPSGSHQTHRSLFELARRLKAILPHPALADLRPVVEAWHTRALPFVRSKAFTDTWFEFGDAWERPKHPAGADPIGESFRGAVEAEPPTCAARYDQARRGPSKHLQIPGGLTHLAQGRGLGRLVRLDFVAQKYRLMLSDPNDVKESMAKRKAPLAADKRESTLLVLFIPSRDRDEEPIDQERWVTAALEFLGRNFGGRPPFRKAAACGATIGAAVNSYLMTR